MKLAISNRKKLVLIAGAAVIAAIGTGVSRATVTPQDWVISPSSPAENSTWHTTDTITFTSTHDTTIGRTPSGGNDDVTLWCKNGYTQGASPTLVGLHTDAYTWQGSANNDWVTDGAVATGTAAIHYPGTCSAFFKTTYRANGGGEALVYKVIDEHGTKSYAYLGYNFTVIW